MRGLSLAVQHGFSCEPHEQPPPRRPVVLRRAPEVRAETASLKNKKEKSLSQTTTVPPFSEYYDNFASEERLPARPPPYYQHVAAVVEDLDEQYCAVMEYQSRKSGTADPADSLFERCRQRNAWLVRSCADYRAYLWRESSARTPSERDVALRMRACFERVSRHAQWHLCLRSVRPEEPRWCVCQESAFVFVLPGTKQAC